MFKIGDRVRTNHEMKVYDGHVGVICRPFDRANSRAWYVRLSAPIASSLYGDQLEIPFGVQFLTLMPTTPFEERVYAYIERELGR